MKDDFAPKIGPRTWLSLLFFFNLLYLAWELAFNSRLVDLSLGGTDDAGVRALELEGRVLSGIGLSLILLRLISLKDGALTRLLPRVAVALAIGFPAMFYGQKILVEAIIDRTSAEQRLDAQHLLLMKRGLADNTLQIDDIAFSKEDLDSAHMRSFLAVLGLMSFVSSDFLESLKSQSERIIEEGAAREADKMLPEKYEAYRDLQEAIRGSWSEYGRLSDAYFDALDQILAEADSRWAALQQDILGAWREIEALAPTPAEQTRQVLFLQRSLRDYFSSLTRCRDSRVADECAIKLEELYREQVISHLGRYVAPTEWCHAPRTVERSVRIGARFVTQRATEQDCDNLDFDHLARKLETYALAPVTFAAFLESQDLALQVRGRLAESGLVLPDDWRANDRATFQETFFLQASEEAGRRIEAEMVAHLGLALPLDLDAQAFIRTTAVQDRLHDALRPLDHTLLIELDYDPDTFRSLFLTPHYVRAAERERERLIGDAAEFANGAEREEEGKRFVRALVVPPVAMGFSLFFSLLNGIGLLASLPALLGMRRQRLAGALLKIGGLGFVIAVPGIYASAITKSDAYLYFARQTEASLSPVVSLFSTWVINTQPSVYALSRPIAAIVPPMFPVSAAQSSFDAAEAIRASMDEVAERANRIRDDALRSMDNADAVRSNRSDDTGAPEDELEDGTHPYGTIARLEQSRPHLEQVRQAIANGFAGVFVDVQRLQDNSFALHRAPVVNGTTTCLTNHRDQANIGALNSIVWRAVHYGSCGSFGKARPASVPLLGDFVRRFAREAGEASLWVHFQPTLHGQVDCHATRTAADAALAALGPERFVAVAGTEEVLTCFGTDRRHRLAYLAPAYGDPQGEARTTPTHLTLTDARRLRAAARGFGYDRFARELPIAELERVAGHLRSGDAMLVHELHDASNLAERLARGGIVVGHYGAEHGYASQRGALVEMIDLAAD